MCSNEIVSDDDRLHHHHSLICSPFPQVAEAVQEELEAYRSSEDEIKRLKHVMVGAHDFVTKVYY